MLQIKVIDQQLLFEVFFHIIPIFGSIKYQTESAFPFQYNIIFETYQSLEPSSSTHAEVRSMRLASFCRKFNS